MTATFGQRKHVENAKRRDRARKEGTIQRALRGSIDRVAEEAAIEAAVRAGKIVRLPMAEPEDVNRIVFGRSAALRAEPLFGASFGEVSRRQIR